MSENLYNRLAAIRQRQAERKAKRNAEQQNDIEPDANQQPPENRPSPAESGADGVRPAPAVKGKDQAPPAQGGLDHDLRGPVSSSSPGADFAEGAFRSGALARIGADPDTAPSKWRLVREGVWLQRTFWPLRWDHEALDEALRILGAPVPVEALVFFDTETTGLSTGAGNLAFLAGMARIVEDGFVLDQFFLEDYPYESEFLHLLRESLASSNLAVSYNGKSFDLPLLQSRMVMNRIPGLDIEQLDLLHVARRFWRDSLESCRLGTIEREVLGIFRVYDMPSAEIPWWYQHYLRTGSGSPARLEELSRVAAHHAMDHLSMALLLQRIGAELLDLGQDGPGRRGPVPGCQAISSLGIFRGLQGRSGADQMLDWAAGDVLQEIELPGGRGKLSEELLVRAGWYLLRNGRVSDALVCYETGAAAGFAACLRRLAIETEHRLRDPGRALASIERWLPTCQRKRMRASDEHEWDRRRSRLAEKLKR